MRRTGMKRLAAGMLAAVLALAGAFPAMAATTKKITSITLNFEADIRPGTDFGDETVEIEPTGDKFSVDGYVIKNEGFEWEEDSVPKLEITLVASDGYRFTSIKQDKLRLKGAGAKYVSGYLKDSSQTIIMTVELDSLAKSLSPIAGSYTHLGFLILMAALTVLSRALDSVTVTRVKVGYGKQGTVTHRVAGEGTFGADAVAYLSLPEDLLVEKLYLRPGDPVQAGETVLTRQAERREEVRGEQADAGRKAELALEQERLSARTYPRVTQELLAGQQLEADERALEVGRQDLAKAQEDCARGLDELRQEYDRLANRSEDEIREEARRAVKSAGRSYDCLLYTSWPPTGRADFLW